MEVEKMFGLNVVSKSYTKSSYMIEFEGYGEKFKIHGRYSKFYNNYSKYGYISKEHFILDIHNHGVNELDEIIRKDYKAFKRAEAYKEKKFRTEARTLAHELKEEHPDLSFSERYDFAWELLLDRNNKIAWKYLKEASVAKISSMKYQKLNKNVINKLPKLNRNFNTLKEFFNEFRIQFDWSVLGLSDTEWSYCPVLKGNHSIVGTGNRLVSYNKISMEGFIFDGYDMLNLFFGMSMEEILEATGVVVFEYEKYKAEKEHYNNVLSMIDDLKVNPYVRKINALDVYQELVSFGMSKINTLNFKGSKNVFYYSIKHILDSIGLEQTPANIAKIGNKINMLAAIGLIKKVMGDEVPKNVFRTNDKGYDYNYFIIPNFRLSDVERKAYKLSENKVGIHNISFKVIAEAFSASFAAKVFNKLKEAAIKTGKTVSSKLMKAFYTFATAENGSVDKALLKNCIANFDTLEDFELNKHTLFEEDDDVDDFF